MNGIAVTCVAVLSLGLAASCRSQQPGASGAMFRGPINNAGNTSPSTILIVPTNEADKAVERKIQDYARGIQRFVVEKMPGRDVKIMTDAEALQADLSQSALSVYGTPQGNLWLARHIAALPVVIEPNTIAADRLYKGSNLRFISAWPHPLNPQKGMVVYTAQRAEDIVGINSLFHGPTDFVVAQGQTVLRAADYVRKDARWAFAPVALTLTQAAEDLGFLFKTIEQVHPDCRANVSKAGYEALKERAYAALKQDGDNTGQVQMRVLGLTAAKAAAALGDGHTGCRLPADLVDAQDRSPCAPALRLRWDAGQVTIEKAVVGLEHLEGARLLQINSTPLEEAVAPILAHLPGERPAFRMIHFLNSQETCWALVRPVQGSEMSVTIRRGQEEPQSYRVPLISFARFRQELSAVPRALPSAGREFHHDGRTCYWRYDSFNPSDQGLKAVDAVFKDIRDHNAQNLVIDLRFNGGGSTAAADHILSYLTREPYRDYSRVDVRLSRQFLRTRRTGWLSPLAWLLQGHVVSGRARYAKPADRGYKFGGSVYVLIGPGTFSSAADFASVIGDFHIGTLVGEETGGLRQCFGDCPTFRMPNSDIPFTVSTKRFYAPIPRPDDATHGSLPNIPVTDERLAPFAGAEDPQVAFVLDLIEKRTTQ